MTATAVIPAPCAMLEQGSDLALVVAFDECDAQRRYAVRTKYNRQRQLLQFARSCPLLDATTRDLVTWLDALELSPSGRVHYVANFSHFYTWAIGEHLIQLDPTSPLRPKDHRERRHFDLGDFPDLLRGFWIAQQRRNLSAKTIAERRRLLGRLQDWMGEASLLDATTDDIERYLDSRKIEAKTRYIAVSHFHAFYRWAVRENLVDLDPTERIDRPQLPSYLPRPIGDADLVLALRVAPAQVAAMLALAAFAGLRCQEIAGLQRTDILDRNRPPMLVVTAPKGRRQRTVPLHPEAWRALEAFGLPRTGPIFRFADGRQLSPWKVSHLGSQYMRGMGIDATLHQLRHWFATALYADTHDLRLVQEMMGHANPSTTAIYTQFSPAAAVSAVTALAPRG
jgi:site-specific recombinase XerD